MTDTINTIADTLIFNDKLAGFHPIFIPAPVKFEFVTPGWYILLSMLILILFIVLIRFYRSYKKNKYRRDAVGRLKILKENIGAESNIEIIEQVSSLLKLTSFQSYGRKMTANLFGSGWSEFLLQKIPVRLKSDSFALFIKQYSNNSEGISKDELNSLIEDSITWVRRHRV